MKVVVCIKQVPDTKGGVKFNPDGTLDRASMLAIMNPDDKAGLEAALRLKDQYGAEVTVVTMGLPKAEEVLREALAMGADKAILVTDRVLGGADTWATSSTGISHMDASWSWVSLQSSSNICSSFFMSRPPLSHWSK